MNKSILLLGVTVLLGSLYLINNKNQSVDYTSRFQEFKARFGKRYGSAEDTYRLAVFTENMIQADIHNANPESTYTMGETQFADLSELEFVDMYLTKNYEQPVVGAYPVFSGPTSYPSSFDWRNHPGTSTAVRNQGQCGSCWAHSAISELEAFYAVKKGQLNLDLSEQQLVDCDTKISAGCNGGFENYGLEYAAKNGITTETAYPYTGKDGTCKTTTGAYKNAGVGQVKTKDANALKSALNVQPLTAAVDATKWSLYTSGVFNNCATNLNHAVMAFGYDANVWIIKNSWGKSWGESGYIRLATGNTCGVLVENYAAI